MISDRDYESCSAKVAIGVVVAVIIVLIGSIINVVILKRNHGKRFLEHCFFLFPIKKDNQCVLNSMLIMYNHCIVNIELI